MGDHEVDMARWVRTMLYVLACKLQEAGFHVMGDGEAMAVSNGSCVLGRLSWQLLKNAI